MLSNALDLSVIVPAFNESEGICVFLDELKTQLDNCVGSSYEVIVVNDGSTDKTLEVLLAYPWQNLSTVNLIRNSGHMAALDAGLRISKGNVVITMDSDLQHPPSLVPLMLATYKKTKCDAVLAIRKRGKESNWIRKFLSSYFYKILSKMTKIQIELDAGDFRLMSRKVVDMLVALPENPKIFRFLISELGFYSEKIFFEAPKRKFGKSKYSYKSLFSLATKSLIGFSTAPLNAIFTGALMFGAFALLLTAYLLFNFVNGNVIPGWTSLMLFLVITSSLQFTAIAIVGRYVSEILKQLRNRPSYVIKDVKSNSSK